MSVLIKGMEMPRACNDCPFLMVDDFEDYFCVVTDNYVDVDFGRADFCPLVEVKTPHGRLIDADEMLAWMRKSYAERGNEERELHFSLLDMEMNFAGPPIIEAEEGNENN